MKYVGLDLGFGNIKIRDEKGGSVFASHLNVPGVDYRLDDNQVGDGKTSLVEFDNMRYVAGMDAPLSTRPIIGLDVERIKGGSEIRAITYAAIGAHYNQFARWRDDVTVYAGVPASLLVGDDKDRSVAAIQGWLKGKHTWKQDGKEHYAVIDRVVVRSQAAGAVSDMAYSLDGKQTKDARITEGSFGIISIGFNTVELSGGIGGKPVPDMIVSSQSGVSSMLWNYGRDGRQSIGLLDWKLRREQLNGHLQSVIDQWSDGIVGLVASQWKSLAYNLDRIILVGGGARYAESALRGRFGDKLWTPDDPVISIARGLYKRAVADGKKG
jgi:hypothetical protein